MRYPNHSAENSFHGCIVLGRIFRFIERFTLSLQLWFFVLATSHSLGPQLQLKLQLQLHLLLKPEHLHRHLSVRGEAKKYKHQAMISTALNVLANTRPRWKGGV